MTTELIHPTDHHQPRPRRTELTSIEPIIGGFHPDPTICRVGDDYYLANSSFEYAPGVPIWHSTDLISWKLIGNALSTVQQFAPGHAAAGMGIYAPTLRYHDGRFWLITTDVSRGGGHLVVSAEHAAGPWSEAIVIAGVDGIDPDLAWDIDGACYLSYCSGTPDMPGIAQVRVDLDRGVALERPRIIWAGTGLAYPEGPHLYRIGEWWYLLIAEGGTERGHAVSIARARTPQGPFESNPGNPFFSHRSLTRPVQNTGHADLVQNADDSWSMVYLGVRSAGPTPWFHVNGRETFLAGLDWREEWPVVDETRYRAPVPDRSFGDDFTAATLNPRWVSPGRGRELAHRDGGPGLLLAAAGDPRDALMARVTDRRWRFSAEIMLAGAAGSVMLRVDDEHNTTVTVDGSTATARLRIGPLDSTLGATSIVPAGRVTVFVTAHESAAGPDDIALSIDDGAGEQELARFDGRYLSTEVAGGFTGRVVGVRSDRGSVRLLRVRYEAEDAYLL